MELERTRKQAMVLLIDAAAPMRHLARVALEQAGMAVTEAGSEDGALAAFRAVRPDLVLLAARTPQCGAFALCRALQRLPGAGAVPVLMLTGAGDSTALARACDSGGADVIAEPVDWRVLPHRLRCLLDSEVRQSKARLREVLAHQDRVKESERIRIAREIHDELGSVLTGIKSYFSFALDRAVRLGQSPDPHLLEADRLADQAIATARRVISDLRPSVLDHLGIWSALEWHAGQVEQHSGIRCSVSIAPELARRGLDAERSTALFRIVQESLTNVVRHAGAGAVWIVAERRDGALFMSLRDDGHGFGVPAPDARQSWGIEGMHERARYLGGDMRICSVPGSGTTVELRLPLEPAHGC